LQREPRRNGAQRNSVSGRVVGRFASGKDIVAGYNATTVAKGYLCGDGNSAYVMANNIVIELRDSDGLPCNVAARNEGEGHVAHADSNTVLL
jgi:hypothetical protein